MTTLADVRSKATTDATSIAGDRFERRLAEELSRLRIEMHEGFASTKVEILRWSFLFWLGQIGATAGLLALLARNPFGH